MKNTVCLQNNIDFSPFYKINRERYGYHFCLYYKNSKLLYTFIPKNACTTLKYTLGVTNENYDHTRTAHFHDKIYRYNGDDLPSDVRRLIVLRDPFARIISAYLEKIVNPPYESFAFDVSCQILKNQRGFLDTDKIRVGDVVPTFKEFICYLFRRTDMQLNEHWRAQVAFPQFPTYDYVFCLERLSQDWLTSDLANIAFHSASHHAVTAGKEVAQSMEELGLGRQQLSNLDGAVLRKALHAAGKVPSVNLFYNDEQVFERFCTRYAQDIKIYLNAFGPVKNADVFERAKQYIDA